VPSLPFSALINVFPDIIGKLESEATVGESIPDPPLFWFRMRPPDYKPEDRGEIGNWRAPILAEWNSLDTRIHIMRKN
jgi:hypothetical protein